MIASRRDVDALPSIAVAQQHRSYRGSRPEVACRSAPVGAAPFRKARAQAHSSRVHNGVGPTVATVAVHS